MLNNILKVIKKAINPYEDNHIFNPYDILKINNLESGSMINWIKICNILNIAPEPKLL